MASEPPDKDSGKAAKPCHTCRRRRVTCDRAYPNCQKCKRTGQECLGYDKLFRWTNGVASRGKLASGTMTMFRTKTQGKTEAEAQSPPSPRILVDPLFQDVVKPYRRYLSYYSERFCLDLVAYDIPNRNPFRDLIPLTKTHPLILHTLVAVSAAHMSNLTRIASPDNLEDSNRAHLDTLVAKQTALELLYAAIKDVGSVDADVILAAVLFFINIELIQSGKEAWMSHLEGAGRIMSALPLSGESANALRDYMMSDCLIYYVLSSAFKPSVISPDSYFHSPEFATILSRTSANQYLCCPPEILQILLETTEISSRPVENATEVMSMAEAGAKLIERALAVDVHVWACTIRNFSGFEKVPIESRIHVGSAHRLTACLYILQAIPLVAPLVSVTTEELCAKIHHHLSYISPDDANFKATPWQNFVLCASATDPVIREWALDRFYTIVQRTPWGFLQVALEKLHAMWNEAGIEANSLVDRRWVQRLRDSGQNFVIV